MTQPNILAAAADLFFAAKIKGAADGVGVSVRFAKSCAGALAQARAEKPSLVLIDLHATQCEPLALAEAFKSDAELRDIPLLGFFSHVQTALMHQARAAGYDQVLPRSAFVKRLPEILQEISEGMKAKG